MNPAMTIRALMAEQLLNGSGMDIFLAIRANICTLCFPEATMRVYGQRLSICENGRLRVAERIVNINQPRVRPIVKCKAKANVNLGSKINVSLLNGIVFIGQLSFDAFDKVSYLLYSVGEYRRRHGFYPSEIQVESNCFKRDNHRLLKERGTRLMGLPQPPSEGGTREAESRIPESDSRYVRQDVGRIGIVTDQVEVAGNVGIDDFVNKNGDESDDDRQPGRHDKSCFSHSGYSSVDFWLLFQKEERIGSLS